MPPRFSFRRPAGENPTAELALPEPSPAALAFDERSGSDGLSPVEDPSEVAGVDDEAWLAPDTRRKVRMAVPTFLLCALAVVAGAFWGGAVAQKHFGTSESASATAATGRARFAGGGGFAGFAGGEGFAGTSGAGGSGFTAEAPTAEGTISAISGRQLTVKATSGSLVKVMITSATTVTRSGKGSPGALAVGDTVRVEGTKASDGTVSATSLTATAAGVSATGGFGGFGGATGTGFSGVGTGSAGSSSSTPTVANGGFSGDGSGVSGG